MKRHLSLSFLGDFCPSCEYLNSPLLVEKSLSQIIDTVAADEIFFINLECSITKESTWRTTESTLRGIEPLEKLKPAIVNVANNHFFDPGSIKVEEVLSKLRQMKLFPVGVYSEAGPECDVFEFHGVRVGIISRVSKGSQPNCWSKNGFKILPINFEEIAESIIELRDEVDLVVVSLHWGAEYYSVPSPWQRRLASRLKDVGADVVWGHHAHRLQETIQSGNCLIMYNLGNLLFGADASDRWPKESERSSVVSWKPDALEAKQYTTRFIPNQMVELQSLGLPVVTRSNVEPKFIDFVLWPLIRIFRELFLYGLRYISRKLKSEKTHNSGANGQGNRLSPFSVFCERLRRCLNLKIDE